MLIVFPHHLLMDFAMPRWAMVIGQIASHAEGLPVFAVIAYGALTNIYRSGMRWRMPAMLVVLAMFGWAAGIVPAIIDGTISVNRVMHNTLWVPGHFHFYLLLGVLPMLLAFMYHLIGERADRTDSAATGWAFAVVSPRRPDVRRSCSSPAATPVSRGAMRCISRSGGRTTGWPRSGRCW